MKDHLLVTLADRGFLRQAKQLFSSVYWNAGWQGDYMLLAHEIPEDEQQWFKDRGILIRNTPPDFVVNPTAGPLSYSATVTAKLFLFSIEFKRWDAVVFVDADCIVRSSLDALTRTHRFAAARDWLGTATLESQTLKPDRMSPSEYQKAFRGYSLTATTFNTGVFAFNTAILTPDRLTELATIASKYQPFARFPEQLWMNLHFYRNWERLPPRYNLFASYLCARRRLRAEDIDATILHFPRFGCESGYRCWEKENPFYNEWKGNLDRAELIDIKRLRPPARRRPRAQRRLATFLHIRLALQKDYLNFVRNKLSLRTRLRRLRKIMGRTLRFAQAGLAFGPPSHVARRRRRARCAQQR